MRLSHAPSFAIALPVASLIALVAACDSAPSAPSASATTKATAAAPPASSPAPAPTPAPTPTASSSSGPSKPLAPNALDITSMNIALEPPAGTTGTVQLAGPDAILRFPGHEVSLTISVAHGDMAYAKKRVSGEPGFVRWDYEKDNAAIAEIEVDKAKEYMGFTVKKLGDASFECGTLTMKRRTSPNEKAVKEALALCETLRAK